MQVLAVVELQAPMSGAAKGVCLFLHRVEHRREVAGRGIDDLQYLGGCGLLLQGLARLSDEPRVLHRNDRLVGEILQQRDLLLGKWPYLLTKHVNDAPRLVVFEQRHHKRGSSTGKVNHCAAVRVAGSIDIAGHQIFTVYDPLLLDRLCWPSSRRIDPWLVPHELSVCWRNISQRHMAEATPIVGCQDAECTLTEARCLFQESRGYPGELG